MLSFNLLIIYTFRREYNVVLVIGLFGFENRYTELEWTHSLQTSQAILDKFTISHRCQFQFLRIDFHMNETENSKQNLFSKSKTNLFYSIRFWLPQFPCYKTVVDGLNSFPFVDVLLFRVSKTISFSQHMTDIFQKELSTHLVCFAIYWLICVHSS